MRKLTIAFALTIAIGCGMLSAQSQRYQSAMQENITKLDTASKTSTYYALMGSFERIANAEKSQWLPYYYAAFCGLHLARLEGDLNLVDTKVSIADQAIQKADSLSPDNSEVYCLKAFSAFMKIKVDFMTRGPKYIAIADEALLKAQQFDENNPRIYLLAGQSKYGVPEQFGGSKEAGCRLVGKSLSLYEEPVQEAIEPRWGKDIAQGMSAKCIASQVLSGQTTESE